MDEPLKLRVSELDFSEIKNNFIEYLKAQDYFRDFDYEGSTINSILDLLAYNTHYNSFYLNMVANEMFVDSAVLRSSLISMTKLMGYKPKTRTGAQAKINITFSTDDNPSLITIPKNTKVFSTINGVNFTFVTDNSYSYENTNLDSIVTVSDINIKEGEPLTYQFTVDNTEDSQRFILPNLGIDESTVEVFVQESSVDTRRSKYVLASNLFNIGSTSNVFFTEETTDFYQEIIFGDNVLGRKPKSGNIVIVNYNVCSGSLGNGANTFFALGNIAGYDSYSISVNDKSSGGSDEESLESIRFNAPRNYSAQNRAVTLEDYKSIITRDYPSAQSVVVYGGESAVPPVFGKVFIGIRPKSGITLSTSVKNRIKNDILKKYNIASITPEFVDIDYMDIVVESMVKFNSSLTSRSIQTLKSLILSSILNYSSTQLETFETSFTISSLQRYIDNTDKSIIGNDTKIKLKKSFLPDLDIKKDYSINFNNLLHYPYSDYIGTISSSSFSIEDDLGVNRENCKIENKKNVLTVYNYSDGEKITRRTDIGSVNMETGRVQIYDFNPYAIVGDNLDIIAQTESNNLSAINEQIFLIRSNNVKIEMIDLSTTITTNAQ